MKKIKSFKREKEFDTMTIVTDIGEIPLKDEDEENAAPHVDDKAETSNGNDVDEADMSVQSEGQKSNDPLSAKASEAEDGGMDEDRSTKETVNRKSLADTQKKASDGKPTQIYEPRPLTPEDDIYDDIIEQFASAPTKPKYWFEEFGDYWSCSCGHINKGDYCKSCGLERELLRSLFILHKPADAVGKLDKKLNKNKEQVDKEEQQHADKESRRKAREASGEDLDKVVPIETDDGDEDALTSQPAKEEKAVIASNQHNTGKKHRLSFKAKIAIAIAACLILISICGFAIYKVMAAPAMQYEDALQLQKSGKYEKAIEKYEALGDYKDAKNRIWECWILMGDSFYENGDFQDAINAYETALDLKEDGSIHEKIRLCYIAIGDSYYNAGEFEKAIGVYTVASEIAAGDDVVEKINAAKLGYVKTFQADRTKQVEAFLDELVEAGYPGAQELYDAYYAWHTSIIANTSEDDYSSDVDTVSRKSTVYFHATLSGGEPDESLRLYYEVSWPDGHTEIYNLDSEWRAGDRITARFQYVIPIFGKEGKLTFTLYDRNTREALGSDSVMFKN